MDAAANTIRTDSQLRYESYQTATIKYRSLESYGSNLKTGFLLAYVLSSAVQKRIRNQKF
jgi:hypothetical protein